MSSYMITVSVISVMVPVSVAIMIAVMVAVAVTTVIAITISFSFSFSIPVTTVVSTIIPAVIISAVVSAIVSTVITTIIIATILLTPESVMAAVVIFAMASFLYAAVAIFITSLARPARVLRAPMFGTTGIVVRGMLALEIGSSRCTILSGMGSLFRRSVVPLSLSLPFDAC